MKIMKKLIKLGKFKIESGVARVSDPCYDKDTWCAGIVKVKKGEWKAQAIKNEEGRVVRLTAFHKDNEKLINKLNAWKTTNIDVGVDSGQCGIYDDKYFKDDNVFAKRTRADRKYKNIICENEPWYSWNCDTTCAEPNAGTIPFGCVSSTGGDGSYICRTISKGHRVVAVEIDFGI